MIGTRVGDYDVVELLGRGGMGAVYRAVDTSINRSVAIKVLLLELTSEPSMVSRFLNEARIAGSLQNSHIPIVYSVGQTATGAYYIAFELLTGRTLGAFMRERGVISPELATQFILQILDPIHVVHERGIIHRDLKPDNVFLAHWDGEADYVKVLDFGIAKLRAEMGGSGTRTGTMIGTPAFMPPEGLRGLHVDATADIYSVGVLAYFMTTGTLPYQDEALSQEYEVLPPAEISFRIHNRPVPDPRARNPALSEVWANAIRRCLDPNAANRPQSAFEAAQLWIGATHDGPRIADRFARRFASSSSQRALPAPRPTGAMVASRYVLGDKLGEGGMAEVFHGTVVGVAGFTKPVAIKRIAPGFAANARFASMFVDEANIIAALDHPNIVAVLAFERSPDKSLFLVMEFVDGVDLSTLSTSGRVPPSIAIMICIRVCRALAYAHARGVIHRDVSPQNVLLSWLAAVKLSDFGLAKILKESGDEVSQVIKGKPAYMSPEQANGEALDGRTDVWAVGVILWELLTGQRLFNGEGVKETLAQVFFREIPPPRMVKGAAPIGKDVEAVVMRMLQRDRDLRYSTADDVVAALSECADAKAIADPEREVTNFLERRFPTRVRAARRGGSGQAARAAMQMTVTGTPTTLGGAASQSFMTPPRRGARWLIAAASLVVVGAAGAVGFVLTNARHSEATPLAESTPSSAVTTRAMDAAVEAAVVHDAPAQIAAAHDVAVPDAGEVVAQNANPVTDAGASSTPSKSEQPAARPSEPHHAPNHVSAQAGSEHATAQGLLTVLIDPWADVYVDSKRIHSTPLVRLPLSVGVHQVKLVNPSGKQEQKSVTINADKETTIDEIW